MANLCEMWLGYNLFDPQSVESFVVKGRAVYGYQELIFWGTVWLVAFLASVARSARDADGNGPVRCIGLASTSGFFALGVTCFWCGRVDATTPWPWSAVGVAAFLGLLSREQDKYVRQVFGKLAKVLFDKAE